MTDTGQTAAPAPEPAAPAAPAAPVVPDGPSDPATATDFDDRWTGEQGRDFARRLRDENKATREKYQQYDKAFGTLHPDDTAAITDFAQALATGDDARARQIVESMYKALTPAEKAAADAATATEPDPDASKPVTMADLQKFYADQQAGAQAAAREQADKAAAAEVVRLANGLGYDLAKNPVEYRFVLTQAQVLMEQATGAITVEDALKQADASLKGLRQQTIDEYVAPKAADAARIPTTASNGQTPVADTTPKSLSEAHRRASERLRQ